jgi:hypothetical protein
MIQELSEKIEEYFKDDLILSEAKEVLNSAVTFNKLDLYYKFIKNAKEKDDMLFRIDCLKSILISEGLIEKKQNDKFGNVELIDFGNF